MWSFFRKRNKKKNHPPVGLALGSGGAKGMAHLGALKAFEEHGLTFDIVTGTSIGAIVGALYAKGYSSADMWGIIESINRNEFARNLRPFSDLEFAEKLLEEYLEGDVSDLNKPFACWATDAQTNKGVLLNEGKTAHIVTASAAIPPFFRGVNVDGKILYDGAFSNAIPADVCKDMGAKAVIGCDLSAFKRAEEDKSTLMKFVGTAVNAFMPVQTLPDAKTRGYAAADVMLRPNLYGFSSTDVSRAAMAKMFDIGYEEATAHVDEIKEAIAKANG